MKTLSPFKVLGIEGDLYKVMHGTMTGAEAIDNISAGLCTGTQNIPAGILLPATTLIHICMIRLGLYTGHILAHKGLDRFSWLGAAILMGLAFLRLL